MDIKGFVPKIIPEMNSPTKVYDLLGGLIAIEIENSNKGKHMMGNIINASILGKVGIIVTFRNEFYKAAINMRNYLLCAFEMKNMGHNPLAGC